MVERTITVEGIPYHVVYHEPDPQNHPSPSTAPLVLLSHALMSNHHMWDATVPRLLASGHRTLSYDHIGHNLTPAPTDRPSSVEKPAYHFDDFVRHMRQLVQETTTLSSASRDSNASSSSSPVRLRAAIGCSMGGVLVLRYAMLHPTEIECAISCDAPGMTSLEAAKPLWSERIAILENDTRNGTDELARKTVARWMPGQTQADEVARETALPQVKSCSLEGYRICADAIRNYDYEGQLGNIKETRCLVLVGSEDPAVGPPEVLQEVAKSIPGAEYVCIQGAGHLPPLDRPDEFGQVMLGFLGKDQK